MRYGLPYKGSKNSIAQWIISELPRADYFCDLFFGGGAVTHAAILSQKYKNFIINDIDARLPKFFIDCIEGKYTILNHPEWVSRQEFKENKDADIYISLVWSFGNNGVDYLYGQDVEYMKHAYHIAVYNNDLDALKPYGYKLQPSDKQGLYERYLDFQKQIIKINDKDRGLESSQRLIALERINGLSSMSIGPADALNKIQTYGTDYQNIVLPDNALIYCDIPYRDTKCDKYNGFDHDRFYEWAEKQDNIFISEYSMPDNFIPYAYQEKIVLAAANSNSMKAKEILFTNERTFEKLDDRHKAMAKLNFCEQMSLF